MSRGRIVMVLYVLSALFTIRADTAEPAPANEHSLLPLPKDVPAPRDNPVTVEKVALGRWLFFDPRLSGDDQLSCATCHLPDRALADGLVTAKGAGGKALGRNTLSLYNVGFLSRLFWDGRAGSLEEQAFVPIESPEEMNQNWEDLERELNAIPQYVKQFERVFGTSVNRTGIAQALAAFQRTLVTGPSSLDRYLAGDKEALSAEAKRGLELFVGEGDCIRCHHGPLLTDEKFHRLGISYTDKGLGTVTGRKQDDYKFRTPSLRNVAHTGPYMHDGSLKTLDDVVFFYFRGASSEGAEGLALDIEPLTYLSYSDIAAVVAFLQSLSGKPPEISSPDLPH